MQSAEFNEIIEAKLLEIQNTLLKKGKEYAPGANTDRLANFRKAAHLQSSNMKQALQGMQAKHIVSISDMIASGEDYPQEVWDEKIGDALVYYLLLTAVVIEEKAVIAPASDSLPVFDTFLEFHNTYPLLSTFPAKDGEPVDVIIANQKLKIVRTAKEKWNGYTPNAKVAGLDGVDILIYARKSPDRDGFATVYYENGTREEVSANAILLTDSNRVADAVWNETERMSASKDDHVSVKRLPFAPGA